jgi:glycine cleavage system pyridoxal-binding protein P
LNIEIVTAPSKCGKFDSDSLETIIDDDYAAVYVEQPAYTGNIEDCQKIADAAHGKGAKFIISVYPIALGLLKKPSECGADIVVGEGQPLGLGLAFGGPYLGFMGATKAMQRKLPVPYVGETVDRTATALTTYSPGKRTTHPPRKSFLEHLFHTRLIALLPPLFTLLQSAKKVSRK